MCRRRRSKNSAILLGTRLRQLSDKPIDEVLRAPVSPTAARGRIRSYLLGRPEGQDAALAGLTIGDVLYDASRVDPVVLEAADFARADDLSSVFSFGAIANRIQALNDSARLGSEAQIQGYVAERLVAQELQSQGFEVEFPELPNEPGYDLLVNGHPYQVKCLSDPSGVHEHLEKYPGVPVFVNSELADHFEGHDQVFAVHNISHAGVVEATHSSLEAGAEILDLEIPLIAMTVAAGRNAWALATNRTDLLGALANASLDTLGGSLGGSAGAAASAATVSLWMASGYLTIVAPIVGAVAGAQQGRRLARWVRAKVFCSTEENALARSISALLLRARTECNAKLRIVQSKAEHMEEALHQKGQNGLVVWRDFRWRLDQEIAYMENKLSQLRRCLATPHSLDRRGGDLIVASGEASLLVVEAGVPPYSIRAELHCLADALEGLKHARQRFSV